VATVSPGSGESGDLAAVAWERVVALAGFMTGMFPAWLLGCVYWAWARPATFAAFHPAYSGNAVLTLAMLGVGFNLSTEVRYRGRSTIILPLSLIASAATSFGEACRAHAWRPHACPPLLQEFRRVLAAPARVVDGLVLQYLIPPALALLISRLFCLPQHYALG
jgi:predicted Na+-dependent transporter